MCVNSVTRLYKSPPLRLTPLRVKLLQGSQFIYLHRGLPKVDPYGPCIITCGSSICLDSSSSPPVAGASRCRSLGLCRRTAPPFAAGLRGRQAGTLSGLGSATARHARHPAAQRGVGGTAPCGRTAHVCLAASGESCKTFFLASPAIIKLSIKRPTKYHIKAIYQSSEQALQWGSILPLLECLVWPCSQVSMLWLGPPGAGPWGAFDQERVEEVKRAHQEGFLPRGDQLQTMMTVPPRHPYPGTFHMRPFKHPSSTCFHSQHIVML